MTGSINLCDLAGEILTPWNLLRQCSVGVSFGFNGTIPVVQYAWNVQAVQRTGAGVYRVFFPPFDEVSPGLRPFQTSVCIHDLDVSHTVTPKFIRTVLVSALPPTCIMEVFLRDPDTPFAAVDLQNAATVPVEFVHFMAFGRRLAENGTAHQHTLALGQRADTMDPSLVAVS